MRHVVMEPQLIVQNGVIDMIGTNQMLEGSGPLVRQRLDVLSLHRRDIYCLAAGFAEGRLEAEEGDVEHCLVSRW